MQTQVKGNDFFFFFFFFHFLRLRWSCEPALMLLLFSRQRSIAGQKKKMNGEENTEGNL